MISRTIKQKKKNCLEFRFFFVPAKKNQNASVCTEWKSTIKRDHAKKKFVKSTLEIVTPLVTSFKFHLIAKAVI